MLKLKYTKGGKQRLVPIHLSLTEILKQYGMALGIIGYPDAYLFPTVDPMEPVTTHSAQHKFNDILELGDISLSGRKKNQRGSCMHCIRHVFVFNSFANAEKDGRRIDDSVPYLSIYLGHDSLNETEKYLKFSSEMFPEAMELFDGYITNYMPCSVGASHHTVTTYKYAFRLLIEFMYSKKGIPADKITFEQLNYSKSLTKTFKHSIFYGYTFVRCDKADSISLNNNNVNVIKKRLFFNRKGVFEL